MRPKIGVIYIHILPLIILITRPSCRASSSVCLRATRPVNMKEKQPHHSITLSTDNSSRSASVCSAICVSVCVCFYMSSWQTMWSWRHLLQRKVPQRAGNTLNTLAGVCLSVDNRDYVTTVKDAVTKLEKCALEIKIRAEFEDGCGTMYEF